MKKKFVIVLLLLFLVTLSACSNIAPSSNTPNWIIEQWRLKATEEPGIFKSGLFDDRNPERGDPIQLIFEQSQFKDIPVLRSYHMADFENRRDNPELFPTTNISQEQAIQESMNALTEKNYSSFFKNKNILINTYLNDTGWSVGLYKLNDENHVKLEHQILIDSSTGEILWKDKHLLFIN